MLAAFTLAEFVVPHLPKNSLEKKPKIIVSSVLEQPQTAEVADEERLEKNYRMLQMSTSMVTEVDISAKESLAI